MSADTLHSGEATDRQLRNLEEFIGKRIVAVSVDTTYGKKIGIAFDDGTFAVFKIGGWDERHIELDEYAPDDAALHSLGLISAEEYQRRQDVRREAELRAREAQERRQYQALRMKFEGAGEPKA